MPAGWEASDAKPLEQMILSSADLLPKPNPARACAVPLGGQDVADMPALVEVTKTGPFGPRTVELGRYAGVRDPNGRLITMAGERLRFPGYVELIPAALGADPSGNRGRWYHSSTFR